MAEIDDFNGLDAEFPLVAQDKKLIEDKESHIGNFYVRWCTFSTLYTCYVSCVSFADAFGDFIRMFSVYGTLHELPSFYNSRIRITAKPKKVRPTSTSAIASITDLFKDKVKAIYPGTLWCGGGNQARSEREVGLFRNTDICCKAHDKCPSFIEAGEEFKGLKNNGLFTRSHCECDQNFYNCLKNIDSLVSNKIGYTYFNILRPKCFRKQYRIKGCKKWWACYKQ